MSAILTAIIAFLSIIVPGFFLALALLKKTKLNMFEIAVIGFMFGLIFPPTLTWLEAYLIPYVHAFSFSAGLYEANVVLLTLLGIVLSVQQGALNLLGQGSVKLEVMHTVEEPKQKTGKGMSWVWALLLFLMLFTFATRMMSIGIAPKFFEFDPYFDMQSTEFILSHGYQWLYDHSAWPTAINGTPHRIEPIVPYLEAYWYQIADPPANQISTSLLSNVSSFYAPITAALLVFIVFMFLYHIYGEYPAIIGAVLATAMPALITTFIAGEQLLEPWGIFAMFFFYATYLLAVQNMKETRFAVLAGVAFASSFLGAHYYTVIAGVFALYIVIQGVVDVLRKHETRDFYKMNAIIIGIITLFFILFDPYNTVLTNRIPGVLGIPVIIAFPALALIIVALFERGPVIANKYRLIKNTGIEFYVVWLVVLALFALLLIYYTPLGKSVTGYLYLSSHFTTPSIPLFMTVQEYAPTGFNFDFGSAGFGVLGASFFGINATVWFVLILFTLFGALAVYNRDSKNSILALAAIWPLAIAGMIEIKYMPHFGVGYILAFCIIIGELIMLADKHKKGLGPVRNLFIGFSIVMAGTIYLSSFFSLIIGAVLLGMESIAFWFILYEASANKAENSHLLRLGTVLILAVLVMAEESTVFLSIFSAATTTCPAINSQGNSIGFDIYCNVVTRQWLNALTWMKQNIGPTAPRVLSWWDYGDWINWFGNTNAVLRGDNAIAKLDYATAARFVLGLKDGYGPSNLANFSNNVAYAKYVLFDDQLTAKWQALDFLACVHANQTSRAFAISQANGTGSPYVLGTSQCELSHSPAYLMVPISASNINNYCQFASGKVSALKTLLLADNAFTNQTFCTPTNFTNGTVKILDSNGNATNVLLVPTAQFFAGINNLGGQQFATFIALYLPNGPNGTISNAPTAFYSSNYYRGFYLGKLPGFSIVYPSNFTGINYVNASHQVVIYRLNNYTGPNPYVTPKPAWVQNNFTMPG